MIESVPAGRVVVVRVATPSDRVSVPIWVEPLEKMTVPVGLPEPGLTGETVAVSVTGWPATEGLRLEVTVVVVEAWATTTARAGDVLVA